MENKLLSYKSVPVSGKKMNMEKDPRARGDGIGSSHGFFDRWGTEVTVANRSPVNSFLWHRLVV